MATLILSMGQRFDVKPAKQSFSLSELYAILRCQLVETLQLPDGRVLVFDEEGKLHGLAVNAEATQLARPAGIAPADFMVGPVLVCEPGELE